MSDFSPESSADVEVADQSPIGDESERNLVLFCFHCHRPENHFLEKRFEWYYSLLIGFTFGLILFVGPFRCRCCGEQRLFCFDEWHPRILLQKFDWRARRMLHGAARQLKQRLNQGATSTDEPFKDQLL